MENPVIKVFEKDGHELVSALRVPKSRLPFRTRVLAEGDYVVSVGEPDQEVWKEMEASTSGKNALRFEF